MANSKKDKKYLKDQRSITKALDICRYLIKHGISGSIAKSILNQVKQKNRVSKKQLDYLKGLKRGKSDIDYTTQVISGGRKPKEKHKDRHYVYAISDDEFVKFGYAKNPRKRLKELQTANARYLKLIWTRSFSNKVLAVDYENLLHATYKEVRAMGEWFSMDAYDDFCEREYDIGR